MSETTAPFGKMNRRGLLRKTGIALAALPLAGLAVHEADAARRWCSTDPLVSIDGQLADIFLSSDIGMHLSATGPAVIEVAMPTGSSGFALLSDLGFGLRGYDIRFVKVASLAKTAGRTSVRISVYCPASDGSLPVKVTFAPRTLTSSLGSILLGQSASGLANAWVVLNPA
ncbi:MAG: hypothetical protein ACR2OO_06480 [Thermomicrobiales bacterium]